MTFTLNWSITLYLGKSTVTGNQQHIPISTQNKTTRTHKKNTTIKLYKQKCKEIGQLKVFFKEKKKEIGK